MNDLLTWALDLVRSVDPVVRILLAGLAMVCETSVLLGLIVPGDTIVLVVGTAVSSPWEGVLLGSAVVVGSLVGESIGFWLGHVLGPRIRDSRLGRRIGEEHWERAERYLARRGGIAIVLSRFLPVLHSLVPLTVGMSDAFRYRRFIAWTAPACVLWASAYVSVAALAAGTYRELSDRLQHAGYIFVAVIAVFVLVAFAVRKLIARVERRHLAGQDDSAADGVPD